ncbi:MAG: DUF4166 domain-containing protein [Dokdonella sp.]
MTTLYRRILDNRFDPLGAAVQQFHSLQGTHRLMGRCSIRGPESLAGKVICALMRLPRPSEDVAFSFDLDANPSEETWTRRFPQRAMRSRLRSCAVGFLDEHIGPTRLRFSLHTHQGQLSMRLEAIRILGIRWPTRWFPDVWAVEHGVGDRFHFDVGAKFRHLGLLVGYSGHLDLSPMDHAV